MHDGRTTEIIFSRVGVINTLNRVWTDAHNMTSETTGDHRETQKSCLTGGHWADFAPPSTLVLEYQSQQIYKGS